MQSQFKEITFKSETEFNKWLEKTTHKKIFFKDKGQDLLKIWIAESGEILHANLQCSIWNGRFVNMENLEKGSFLQLWNGLDWDIMDFEIAVVK